MSLTKVGMDIKQKCVIVAELLDKTYGCPDLGNKTDPLDELFFVMLTVKTEYGAAAVYDRLKATFTSWDSVLKSDPIKLVEVLRPTGLANQRAARIRSILTRLLQDKGRIGLDFLSGLDDEEAESYLLSLPGVGTKVARCVMMFSLGRQVFPVDTHVFRVSLRLGLVDESSNRQKSQDLLQDLVPPPLRHPLHVNMVVHGRQVCHAVGPRCSKCPLKHLCRYFATWAADCT